VERDHWLRVYTTDFFSKGSHFYLAAKITVPPSWRNNVETHKKMCSHYLLQFLELKWTAVAQWLRCCATNLKVAGSIPGGVIKILY